MSKGFLLDTNVPSELRRPKPDPRVTRWLQAANDDLLYLSVISIGEFCNGIAVHSEQHRADLQRWLDTVLRPWFADRVLPVSEAIAERWGILDGECQLKGQPVAAPDGFNRGRAPLAPRGTTGADSMARRLPQPAFSCIFGVIS